MFPLLKLYNADILQTATEPTACGRLIARPFHPQDHGAWDCPIDNFALLHSTLPFPPTLSFPICFCDSLWNHKMAM